MNALDETNALVDRAIQEERSQPALVDDTHDWPAADELGRSTHAVAAAKRLAESPGPIEQSVAAHLLSSLVNGNPSAAVEAAGILEQMLVTAQDPHLEWAIADALRLMWHPLAVEPLVRLADSHSANVRRAVGEGLGSAMADQGVPIGVDTLIRLSDDPEPNVRDWATFSLGQVGTDTSAIRDALWRRTADPDADTRAEALVALAQRKDPRVGERIARELGRDSVGSLVVEAAEELGDSALLEPLRALQTWWDVDPDLLERAIAASQTDRVQ